VNVAEQHSPISFQVTETYTPPRPSNWGLPDDGRMYSYGKFPALNPDLFGKVRPPRTWRSRRGSLRTSRRASVQTAASERVVFAKAMVPTMRPTNALLAATRRGAKTLEQAITALSNQFTASSTNSSAHREASPDRMSVVSDVTVPSELGMTEEIVTSAEEFVLNHRRRQAILLGIIMTLQLSCRARFGASNSFRAASLNEQQSNPCDSASNRASTEHFAATIIQAFARGVYDRLSYQRTRSSASLIQAMRRGTRTRFAYLLIRETIIRTQSVCRAFLARSRLKTIISGRLLLYRPHLVLLWNRNRTSLCYRSMFWSITRRENILQLALVEEEISCLWRGLGISPPKFPKALDDPSLSDVARLRIYSSLRLDPSMQERKVLQAAANLGATSEQYVQALVVSCGPCPGLPTLCCTEGLTSTVALLSVA
jgi:hypothetical protein